MSASELIRHYWKVWDWEAYRAAVLTEAFLRQAGIRPEDKTESGQELKRLRGHLRRYESHHFPRRHLGFRRDILRLANESTIAARVL